MTRTPAGEAHPHQSPHQDGGDEALRQEKKKGAQAHEEVGKPPGPLAPQDLGKPPPEEDRGQGHQENGGEEEGGGGLGKAQAVLGVEGHGRLDHRAPELKEEAHQRRHPEGPVGEDQAKGSKKPQAAFRLWVLLHAREEEKEGEEGQPGEEEGHAGKAKPGVDERGQGDAQDEAKELRAPLQGGGLGPLGQSAEHLREEGPVVGPDHGGGGLVKDDGQGEVVGQNPRAPGPVRHPEDQEVEKKGNAQKKPGPPPAPPGLGAVGEVAEKGVVDRVPDGVKAPGQGVKGGGEAQLFQIKEGQVGPKALRDRGEAQLARSVAPGLHKTSRTAPQVRG